jgi:hypothetical protein
VIATNANVIGAAVAIGVLLGAGIVLATLWVVRGDGGGRRYMP